MTGIGQSHRAKLLSACSLLALAAQLAMPGAGQATGNGCFSIGAGQTCTLASTDPPVYATMSSPAVSLSGNGATLINNGSIYPSISYPNTVLVGIQSGSETGITVINNATIGSSASGAAVSSSNTSGINFVNNGTINGGMWFDYGSNVLRNTATINGNIAFGPGNDTVIIEPGFQFGGTAVKAGGGTDRFELAGTGTGEFNVALANGVLQDFEAFAKSGTGVWTLTGTGSLNSSQTLAVEQGTLKVNGTLTGGSWSVSRSAVLQGTGRIGSLLNQGIVAPGNSIGTLTIDGNYRQSSDGTLNVEIAADGRSDVLAVTGSASLNGLLSIIPLSGGTFSAGTSYTILTAGSGLSGTFAQTTVSDSSGLLAGLTPEATYGANAVQVVLNPVAPASTPTPAAPTNPTTPVAPPPPPPPPPPPAPDTTALETAQEQTNEAVSRTAVQTVTSSIATRVASVISTVARGPVLTPGPKPPTPSAPSPTPSGPGPAGPAGPREPGQQQGIAGGEGDTGLAFWGDSSITFLDDTAPESAHTGNLVSTMAGADVLIDGKTVIGIALAFDNTDLALRGTTRGASSATGVQGVVYAGYSFDDTFSVDALIGYGHVFNTVRQVPSGGADLKGEYGSQRWFASTNFRATVPVAEAVAVTGTVGYTHALEMFTPYQRSDDTRVSLRSNHTGTVRAAAELSTTQPAGIVAYVTAGLEHDILNRAGGADRTGGFGGVGITADLGDHLTLGAIFNSNFGRGEQTQHQVGANLRYTW